MANRLQQTISLQTKISPQQIQMIKLLELPTMLLEERVKQEIEENIVLEEDVDAKSEGEDAPEKISVEEYIGKEDDAPSYKARINNFSKDDKQRPVYITEGRSLSESLVEQLNYRSLSEEEMIVAVYIVGSIDDDGYLRRDIASLSDDLAFTRGMEVSTEEIERILSIVQELEPAGIGARSLQESLLLQMQRQTLDSRAKRLAHKIIDAHFEAFAKKHYEKLMSRLDIGEEEFREAERVVNGKPAQKKKKMPKDPDRPRVRSLHHIDDDEYNAKVVDTAPASDKKTASAFIEPVRTKDYSDKNKK